MMFSLDDLDKVRRLLDSDDTISTTVTVVFHDANETAKWREETKLRKLAKSVSDILYNKLIRTHDLLETPEELARLLGIHSIRINLCSNSGLVTQLTEVSVDDVISLSRFNQSRARRIRLGGLDSTVKMLTDLVVLSTKHGRTFHENGMAPPRGILLQGPPGCGKTSLVKQVAQEIGAFVLIVNGPELLGSRPGETQENLSAIFTKAESHAKEGVCFIFLDEIDSMCGSSEKAEDARVVAHLCRLLDESRDVIVIGATNRPDSVHKALRRPGRIDREVFIGIPTSVEREQILRELTDGLPLADDVRLKEVAEATRGYVGADLAQLCRETAYSRLSDGKEAQLCMADFQFALHHVRPSTARNSQARVDFRPLQWSEIAGLESVKSKIKQDMASSLEVSETLIRFAKSRQLLRDVYASSRGHFDQLRSILRDEFVRAEAKLNDSEMFLSNDDLAVLEKVLDNDPVIIVSGQTNCGKTSLINELLGGSYLPTSAIPCTARIVKVRYSEINYLQVFDSENKELCERIEFQKKKVPEDKINLESSSRSDKNVVECVVEVGLNNELLSHGLQIIDVPGLSENTALDKLVDKSLDGMLQLVIYVIDGKTSLRTQDTEFISHLKTTAPMAEILFVCNKVEDEPAARKMDRFSDQESDEEDERPDRARMTFGKLKGARLLPSDLQYSTELQYYHGLSCSLIRKARLAKKHREDLEEFVKNFDHFKDSLLKTFNRCVNKHLYRAVSSLLGSQQRVFDFFISDKMTKLTKMELIKHIRAIRQKEIAFQNELLYKIAKLWPNMIKTALDRTLEIEEEYILDAVKVLEFQPIVLGGQLSANHVIEQCRFQVRDYVLMLVIEKFGSVLKQIEVWFDAEASNHKRAAPGSVTHKSDTRVDNILENHLATIWGRDEMNFEVDTLKTVWVAGLRNNVMTTLKRLKEDMAMRVKGIYLNEKWKKDTASAVLDSISTESVTEHIILAIQDKLKNDHRTFLFAMQQIQNLCLLKEKQAHEHKVVARQMIPAYTKNLCITDALANTLRHGAVQLGEKIEQGSRSDVFECQKYMDIQNIVAKKSKVPVEIPNDDFCSLFCYVRLLGDCEFHAKVTAVAFDSLWHFCVILPKYERNLYDLLSSDDHGLSLEERVTMCYEMAKMCDYCTKRGLKLNDLRPNNFFVRTTNSRLSLAFNLSKWKDMSAPYPDGKPPFHFAPEIVLEKRLSHYTFDAYSLTVLLVQLAIGKIVRPKFSENEETIKEIQTLSEKDYVRRVRDDFLEIWEENWGDKELCMYSIIQSLISKYIGTISSDRMGVERFMHDVKHTLLKRLNDRTPDMNSSSASSDDHDSITRSATVPNHCASEYDIISSPEKAHFETV